MALRDDIQYAVNTMRVILEPRQTLETFGTTTIRYHLVSELMDEVNQVRVRAGRVYSERPQIITPSGIGEELLKGFGEDAREYIDFLKNHGEMVRVLKYGLRFRKDEAAEELVHESIETVADRVKENVDKNGDALAAVVIGADEVWAVSLLKVLVDYIPRSAPSNIHDLMQRSHGESSETDPSKTVHEEIEADFIAAGTDARRINDLGEKLQKYGLFESFEDRFYRLLRGSD